MFSKLKVGWLGKILSYRFQYNAKDDNSEFSLPSMVPYVKVKFQVIVFGYRAKIGNSELSLSCVIEKFQLIVFALYIKAITRNSPEFSELSLWPDTQSFYMWGIPPRLEVLPLTQKYQTQQKDFHSKVPDRLLYMYSAQITSLRLNHVSL